MPNRNVGYATTNFQIFCLIYIRSSLADGRQAVYEGVIGALDGLELEAKYQLLHSTMKILEKPESVQDGPSFHLGEIYPLMSDLLESNDVKYRRLARRFVGLFTDCKRKPRIFTDEKLKLSRLRACIARAHSSCEFSGILT